jgi:hypothetical protein
LSSLFFPAFRASGAGLPRGNPVDHVFYDERFARARQLADEMPGAHVPVPVRGDVTGIWNAGLGRASLRSPLVLRGVTTESFYFCLKVMLGSQARVETQVARVDRDLFLWTIRSLNTRREPETV